MTKSFLSHFLAVCMDSLACYSSFRVPSQCVFVLIIELLVPGPPLCHGLRASRNLGTRPIGGDVHDVLPAVRCSSHTERTRLGPSTVALLPWDGNKRPCNGDDTVDDYSGSV